MTTRLVLDTSAYAQLRRGNAEALDLIADAEVVIVPTIVLGELEAGFRAGSRYRENSLVLAEFLDEPFVAVAPVTPSVSRQYGLIFADLRSAGTPLPANDLWIAATTRDEAAHLLTFDRDFERIAGLEATVLTP